MGNTAHEFCNTDFMGNRGYPCSPLETIVGFDVYRTDIIHVLYDDDITTQCSQRDCGQATDDCLHKYFFYQAMSLEFKQIKIIGNYYNKYMPAGSDKAGQPFMPLLTCLYVYLENVCVCVPVSIQLSCHL